jgi:peroxiredoxin
MYAILTALLLIGIGKAAPDFSLPDAAGKAHSLREYRGKATILVFTSTQCSITNAYTDRLKSIVSDYSPKGVSLVAVNSNSDEAVDRIRDYNQKNGLSWNVLKDQGSKVASLYGAERTPEAFIIDGEGVIRYHGRIDDSFEAARVKRNDLREALDELLSGKPVSVAETKAFGCQIKRDQAAAADSRVSLLKPADLSKLKEDAKGKVLVVNFWATWCGPCVAEFPEFVALDEKYRTSGVNIVGISADEVSDLQSKVVPFVRDAKARFPVYVQDVEDPQEMIDRIAKEWSGALPATFVFDRQGTLVYKRLGIIDRDELAGQIQKALKM